MIELSVITAVYNDEKFISQSVESILNQTFKNFEYIIVDDGSTDDTPQILSQLAKKDHRIKIITQVNLGPAIARNTAINSSKGKFVALQDSDDVSHPDRLELQMGLLNKSSHNIICSTGYNVIDINNDIITTNNKIYKNINQNLLNGRFCVCHPSIMMYKDLFVSSSGYNSFYKKSEDYDLIYRLLESGAVFEKLNICLYNLRLRPISEGSTNDGTFPKRVYANHLRRISQKPEDYSEANYTNKITKNHILVRKANELFFSENYKVYRNFYRKHFSKLPIKYFLVYYVYSLIPAKFKYLIKSKLYHY